MSKSNKQKWVEDYDDEFLTDKRRMKQDRDRRKKKRMKNALRSGNVQDLINIDDYDEMY
jgi:hypothetical protein